MAVLPEKIQLEVVTPYRKLVSAEVDEVLLPGELGQLGILPGHRPLLTNLTLGEIAFRQDRHWTHLAVEWGFAEVLPDRVIVLADNALSVADFDPEQALKAKKRAEERLRSRLDRVEIEHELENWKRAVLQLEIADKMKKENRD